MDVTKVFAVLCGFLLIVCLTLSITCLVVMRNAVEETTAWQARAEELVGVLDGCVQAMKEENTPDIPVLSPGGSAAQETVTKYCVRSEGEWICVFDADGHLVRRTDLQTALLPETDHKILKTGVWVDGWSAVAKLLQDYE